MKGAIYTRYSTSNQTPNSTETQVNACVEYCNKNNIDIEFIFSDEELTGFYNTRNKFQELLKVAQSKLIDCVVIYDVTRGSREVADWFDFRKQMRSLDIKVISVTEKLGDIYNPDDFLRELIQVGIGEHSVLQSRQKSIEAKYTKARHAAFLGGFAPLGYDIIDQQYVINEKEAKVVKRIFELYINGATYDKIIEDIKVFGVFGKRGKPISKSTLNGLLSNPRYIGRYIWMENINREMHKWVGKKNDKAVIIEDAIPAIIDKETFELAQQRMLDRKIKGYNRAKYNYLLSGLIYCGECKAPMQGYSTKDTKGHVTTSYVCSNKRNHKSCDLKNINAIITDNLVREAVKMWLLSLNIDKTANNLAKVYRHDIKDYSNEQKELDIVNIKIKNITNLISEGIFYPELKDEINALQLQKDKLIRVIENGQNKIHLAQISAESIKKNIIKQINSLNNEALDSIVKIYVQAVRVNKNHTLDIFIGFNKNNSFSKNLTNDTKDIFSHFESTNQQISQNNNTMSVINSLPGEPITLIKK